MKTRAGTPYYVAPQAVRPVVLEDRMLGKAWDPCAHVLRPWQGPEWSVRREM